MTKLDPQQVRKAVIALLKHLRSSRQTESTPVDDAVEDASTKAGKKKGKSEPKTLPLGDEETMGEPLHMVVSLTKIPTDNRMRPRTIQLPHPIRPADGSERLCLLVKDPAEEAQALVDSLGISKIERVIGIAELKARYKTFEAQRELMNLFDRFVADRKIVHLIPKFLGKKFVERKRIPAAVTINQTLAAQIDKLECSTLLHLPNGPSLSIHVGNTKLTVSENVENILRAFKELPNHLPNGKMSIQSVHIRSCNSIALPVLTRIDVQDKEKLMAFVSKSVEGTGKQGRPQKKRKLETPSSRPSGTKSPIVKSMGGKKSGSVKASTTQKQAAQTKKTKSVVKRVRIANAMKK